MDRIIKFRVWSFADKAMRSHDWLSAAQVVYSALTSTNRADIQVMQFTGLKDKHNVEIYEDDVIQDPGGNHLLVTWNQDSCEYQLDHPDGFHSLTRSCQEWAEVIGNLHQHPHLIKPTL